MQTVAEIAGMFVTHQLWFLSQGAPTTPMLAYESVDGTRQISRLMMEDAREAVAYGEEWLAENPDHATNAVLIADGYITLNDQQVDAVIFQCRSYVEPTGGFTGAVPYRPKSDARGFAVYRLQFLEGGDVNEEGPALGEAFFRGVDKHSHGAEVWDEFFDEKL
jgi:hypothetical protein